MTDNGDCIITKGSTVEMRKTIKLRSPKIIVTNKTHLNVPNLSFEEDHIEVVLQYCRQSPHTYERPCSCMICARQFKHSYMYLLHIKTRYLCIKEETILTDTENLEEAA